MKSRTQLAIIVAGLFLCSLCPATAHAYIGPGAGFAFIGSAFVFILTIFLAAVTVLFWPIQLVWRYIRGKGLSKNAKARRVIVLGLDGLDPSIVDRYMEEGILPVLKRLSEQGTFKRLATTLPSISPVAWSSFQTGVNPGAHNIFDFLSRDKRYYLPALASTETVPPARFLKIFKWRIPLGRPQIKLLRKSQPFWKLLGDRGILCNVLRVPITYPADKFNGNILSAMCAPDLKGTQGSYTLYTSSSERAAEKHTGGECVIVKRDGSTVHGEISGPPDPFLPAGPELRVPFTVNIKGDSKASLTVQDTAVELDLNEFSDWIPVKFRTSLRRTVPGICRFCLRSTHPEFLLYVSPVNISPGKPVLPIAFPSYFSTYLAKIQGNFGTLGLLEDTWALNNRALDDDLFLKLTWLAHDEREAMFFNMLEKTSKGLVVCVFDASDRIQHMFWEQNNGKGSAVREMYQRMDDLVGRTLAETGPEDLLIVMSDHGFNSFRRGVNINTWLKNEGFLVLKEGAGGASDYFQDVDWTRTRAFGLGLGGIYLNREGREQQGIVREEDLASLKQEISAKLCRLVDPENGEHPIRKVYDSAAHYRGVYKDDGPDLIIGCNGGYRVAWESVTGKLSEKVVSDNDKAWCGDHCVDPELVPGVLFMNRKLNGVNPHIMDIAPTVLSTFDVPVPSYMDGKSLI